MADLDITMSVNGEERRLRVGKFEAAPAPGPSGGLYSKAARQKSSSPKPPSPHPMGPGATRRAEDR